MRSTRIGPAPVARWTGRCAAGCLAAFGAVGVSCATPILASAQNSELVGSFRPYLFVLLAFAASWLLIAAWVFRIGRKLSRLGDRMDRDGAD